MPERNEAAARTADRQNHTREFKTGARAALEKWRLVQGLRGESAGWNDSSRFVELRDG